MPAQISILKLRRSQPEQGKRVTVEFLDNNEKSLGMILLSFDYWIKFQKLIQRGQESNAREQYPVRLKIMVEGFVPEKPKVKPLAGVETLPSLYQEPVNEPDTPTLEQAAQSQEEEDAEEELQKALAEGLLEPQGAEYLRALIPPQSTYALNKPATKAIEQQLIRTLKVEKG
jgi:hypothetical protein